MIQFNCLTRVAADIIRSDPPSLRHIHAVFIGTQDVMCGLLWTYRSGHALL